MIGIGEEGVILSTYFKKASRSKEVAEKVREWVVQKLEEKGYRVVGSVIGTPFRDIYAPFIDILVMSLEEYNRTYPECYEKIDVVAKEIRAVLDGLVDECPF